MLSVGSLPTAIDSYCTTDLSKVWLYLSILVEICLAGYTYLEILVNLSGFSALTCFQCLALSLGLVLLPLFQQCDLETSLNLWQINTSLCSE